MKRWAGPVMVLLGAAWFVLGGLRTSSSPDRPEFVWLYVATGVLFLLSGVLTLRGSVSARRPPADED